MTKNGTSFFLHRNIKPNAWTIYIEEQQKIISKITDEQGKLKDN